MLSTGRAPVSARPRSADRRSAGGRALARRRTVESRAHLGDAWQRNRKTAATGCRRTHFQGDSFDVALTLDV